MENFLDTKWHMIVSFELCSNKHYFEWYLKKIESQNKSLEVFLTGQASRAPPLVQFLFVSSEGLVAPLMGKRFGFHILMKQGPTKI